MEEETKIPENEHQELQFLKNELKEFLSIFTSEHRKQIDKFIEMFNQAVVDWSSINNKLPKFLLSLDNYIATKEDKSKIVEERILKIVQKPFDDVERYKKATDKSVQLINTLTTKLQYWIDKAEKLEEEKFDTLKQQIEVMNGFVAPKEEKPKKDDTKKNNATKQNGIAKLEVATNEEAPDDEESAPPF